MSELVQRIIEGTFTAVLVFLVLSNAGSFSIATNGISNLYTSSVKTLQGR